MRHNKKAVPLIAEDSLPYLYYKITLSLVVGVVTLQPCHWSITVNSGRSCHSSHIMAERGRCKWLTSSVSKLGTSGRQVQWTEFHRHRNWALQARGVTECRRQDAAMLVIEIRKLRRNSLNWVVLLSFLPNSDRGMYWISGSGSGWLDIRPFFDIQFRFPQNIDWRRIMQPDNLLI